MRKYRIAILDDEERIISSIESCIKNNITCSNIFKETNSLKFSDDLNSSSMYEDIDIFFLDIEMPGKDGPQIAKEIKEKYPNKLIVFISGYENRSEVFSDNTPNVLRSIDKPINDEKIKKVFEKIENESFCFKGVEFESPERKEYRIHPKDILFITSDFSITPFDEKKNNIVLKNIHKSQSYRIKTSLTQFIKDHNLNLTPISGSCYINKDLVHEEIEAVDKKRKTIKLKNNDKLLQVTRDYLDILKELTRS